MKIIKFRQTLLIAFFLAQMTLLHAEKKQISRSDIVIADFEQGYGDWVVKGEAFNHPTTTIVGAKGFIGKRMADSWDPGLSPNIPLAGTLTSPVPCQRPASDLEFHNKMNRTFSAFKPINCLFDS